MSYDTAFNQTVEETLASEGVLSDQPSDKGGLTKYGITKPFLQEYLGRPASSADILALKRDDAIDVYHSVIWLKRKVGSLPYPLSKQVFDFEVNSGRPGIVALQELVGATQDGNIGPETMARLNSLIQKIGMRRTCNEYVIARGRYLMEITQHDPDHTLAFLKGWFNRDMEHLDFGY